MSYKTVGVLKEIIFSDKYSIVKGLEDLPDPVQNIITLPAGTTWHITKEVDLGPIRIVCEDKATIAGLGPETCKLYSTQLGAGEYLISTEHSLVLNSISLEVPSGATCVKVDNDGSAHCDWIDVSFYGGRAAELTDIKNAVMLLCSFFADGVHLLGSVNTLSLTECTLTPGSGDYGVYVGDAASVDVKLRLCNCSVVTSSGATGVRVPNTRITKPEGFMLMNIDFSGPGTYVSGTTEQDEESRWFECRGITNTRRIGAMGWSGNATPTDIVEATTPVKATGTSTANVNNQHFSHTNNRLTYTSELKSLFTIRAGASFIATSNKQISMYIYKNGAQVPGSFKVTQTTDGNGKADNASVYAVTTLEQNDYIELWISNDSTTGDVTVVSLDVLVSE